MILWILLFHRNYYKLSGLNIHLLSHSFCGSKICNGMAGSARHLKMLKSTCSSWLSSQLIPVNSRMEFFVVVGLRSTCHCCLCLLVTCTLCRCSLVLTCGGKLNPSHTSNLPYFSLPPLSLALCFQGFVWLHQAHLDNLPILRSIVT